jgi:class 3 adenylate cyclase
VGPRLTLAEASARSGVPAEHIAALLFAAGLPVAAPDEPLLTEADAPVLAVFSRAEVLFGREPLRRFVQVLGSSLARTAEAAVSLSRVNLERPAQQSGGGELARLEARFRAAATVGPLADAVALLFKAHLGAASQRLRRAQPEDTLDTVPLGVGFVDLVGFTSLSRQVEPRALAAIIGRFEETAHDVAVQCGGRVVKFVGDEVMFVTPAVAAACNIAITLVERFTGDGSVTPRGGLAAGDVLVRGGDYYGPVVNLAARLAELAVPSEVLVTEAVATRAVGSEFRFAPAGRRLLKGLEDPVPLFAAERSR